MKTYKLILKIAAITAVICGIVFTVIYFWDNIKNFCSDIKKSMKKFRIASCPFCREESDFADM